MDAIALDGRGVSIFRRPTVPAIGTSVRIIRMDALSNACRYLDWYFNEIGNAINAKPLVVSPNSHGQIANMDRCYNVVRIIHGNIHLVHVFLDPIGADSATRRNGTLARPLQLPTRQQRPSLASEDFGGCYFP